MSPPDARATFPGFVYQLGNLGAAGLGYLQGSLVVDWHWTYAQALSIAAVVAAVMIALFVNFGPEARDVNMSAPKT